MQRGASQRDFSLVPRQRGLLAATAVIVLGLLALARGLTPSPTGRGTHQQLGLAPCWIFEHTGVPCPSCGMTTAWAHAARGELRQAVRANLAGTISAMAALLAAPWLLISAVLGRWLGFRPTLRTLLIAATVWLIVAILDWATRLAIP